MEAWAFSSRITYAALNMLSKLFKQETQKRKILHGTEVRDKTNTSLNEDVFDSFKFSYIQSVMTIEMACWNVY